MSVMLMGTTLGVLMVLLPMAGMASRWSMGVWLHDRLLLHAVSTFQP
jgi:hypothetical protein